MKRLMIALIVGVALIAAVPGLRRRAAPAIDTVTDGAVDAYELLVDKIFAWSVRRELRSIASVLKLHADTGSGLPNPDRFAEYLRRERLAGGVDPWGQEYYLEMTVDLIVVGSSGPDTKRGTEDDIRETVRIGE